MLALICSEAADGAENTTTGWSEFISDLFTDEWWVFLVTLGIVLLGMIIIKILTKGKVFKIRTILKVAINCVIAFILLFMINTIGSIFGFVLIPKWYSWLLIGIFGILAVIFLFVSYFVWPGLFVSES